MGQRPRRAPFIGALSFSTALVVLLWFPGEPDADSIATCPAARYDDRGVVRHVFDGDTLELSDGRRVRLLGINTPELGHDGGTPEPFAEPALTFLESVAAPGTRVKLRLDSERKDRYGRLLAHVFLRSGVNVQAELLAAGLAMTLVVPPNVWNHDCYARLEQAARADGRGMWRLDRFRPAVANRLHPDTRGFRIVTGEVERIGEGSKNLWLNLAPGMAVRVPKDDLIYFENIALRALVGRRVEVRGYIARRRGELRMTVRHPAALRVLQ
jgi:micrococcal nuclease